MHLNRRRILEVTLAASAQLAMGCRQKASDAKYAAAQGPPPAQTRKPAPLPTRKPAPAPAGTVVSDGLKIHYETFGAGRPMVLVHGWGSSIKGNWVDTGWVEALKPLRRVVALDVRGHGDSDKPHEQSAYSYAAMSRDVLGVMDHLGIDKADYLGYSMGSCMGVWLLGHARERFTSMVLGGLGDETDESLVAVPKIVAGLRAKDPKEIADPVSKAYRAYAAADPRNDLEALALSALQMWPEGDALKLGGPGLAAVDIPVLVVNGANDRPYIDNVQKFIDAVPGARLEAIPDRDHLSVVPDPRFKERVVTFLTAER